MTGVCASAVSVDLLGPPLLQTGAGPVRLPYQRALAVLVYLVVEGRAVDRSILKALLWEDQDEQRASGSLRQALYAIRHALPDVVVTEGQVVKLDRGRVRCDLDAMRAPSSGLLALRRGPLCEGLQVDDAPAFDEWLTRQRERADRLFAEACLQRASLEERAQRTKSAIEAARRAVETAPWLESAHTELIRLLHSSGDAGAALHQLHETTRVLEEEIGITPSSDLAAMLEGSRVVGLLPASRPQQFQGRASELAALERHVCNPLIRLVTVCGPPGTGKTTLVTRLLESLPRRGLRIVFQRLYAAEPHPLQRVFERLLETLSRVEAQRLRGCWQARASLDGRIEVMVELLSRHPGVLVLDNCEEALADDLGWRPEFSDVGRLLESLVDFDHRTTLVLISRYVPQLPPEIEGRAIACRADLILDQGLAVDEAVAMLQALGVGGDARLLAEVGRRCQGIPRVLEAVAGLLRQRRSVTLAQLAAQPEALDDLVVGPLARLHEGLGDDERRVMDLLAVSERSLSPSLLIDVLGGSHGAAVDRLLAHVAVHLDEAGGCFLSSPARRWLSARLTPAATRALQARLTRALGATRPS